ncbi:MAG TPA: MoaD/ThiS family protein [Mycobacteriales bacterium]
MIRVVLPAHLKALARVSGEVALDVPPPATVGGVLDALEGALPVLAGRIRDYGGGPRRAYVRFYACQQDLSHEPYDTRLPNQVADGTEPLLIVGAMSGG